jgi:general L-amino acid transport system permease protein
MKRRPLARTPLWRDTRVRAALLQALLLALVVLLIGSIVNNTLGNLARQGIASGFGFLGQPAGFGIGFSLIEYHEAMSYGRAFLVGLSNTLLVSALGVIAATLLGFIIGVARLSPNWLIRQWAAAYIEIFRNLPLLLQIFFWYFAVLRALPHPRQSHNLFELAFLNSRGLYVPRPVFDEGFGWVVLALLAGLAGAWWLARRARKLRLLTGEAPRLNRLGWLLPIVLPLLAAVATGRPLAWDLPELQRFNFTGGMVLIPELIALWLALTTYTAAFIGEIVRAGIQSVAHGQREAATALGLSPALVLRKVILPQAMRVIVPPLTNQYLNLTKNSSLAAAIAYPDLVSVFAGTVLNQTGQAVEVISITMAVYLAISLTIAAFMNWYNRRIALVER